LIDGEELGVGHFIGLGVVIRPVQDFGCVFFRSQFFSFLLFQNRIGTAQHWDYYVDGAGVGTDKNTTILENVFLKNVKDRFLNQFNLTSAGVKNWQRKEKY
jgi:hypothetical protein